MPEFPAEYLQAISMLRKAFEYGTFSASHRDAYEEIIEIKPTDGNLRAIGLALADIEARRILSGLGHRLLSESDKRDAVACAKAERAYLMAVEDLMDEILYAVGSGTRLRELRRKARGQSRSA